MKKIALLSVSDKTGLVDFASGLVKLGFHLLSTGGTSKAIAAAGLPVEDISHFTGFPEMMDGRVKTLNPKVHGGILALRDNPEHQSQAAANGILPIDLVCVNLYPFEKAVSDPDCTLENAIENIDIGGPAMLRSSAKNYRHVVVVTDAADYEKILAEYQNSGDVSLATREILALKVFRLTSHYDGAIHTYLNRRLTKNETIRFTFENGRALRYGENPHQKAWIHPDADESRSNVPAGQLLHGKEMSYNNYLDADASFETAWEFRDECAAVIVKHGNPCGIATGKDTATALKMAWEGDIVSAFGSVITVTRKMDLPTAEFLKGKFVEVLIAPGFSPEALDFLKNKSKDIRLIEVKPFDGFSDSPDGEKVNHRFIRGALLSQTPDLELMAKLESVTKKPFSDSDRPHAAFAFKCVKHIKSNAITLTHEYEKGRYMLLGMGAGQPNRVDSVRKLSRARAEENIARLYGREKTVEKMAETLLSSDAFFPFADNIDYAHEMGVRKILQPGGSVKDADVIASCDEKGIAMAFTGTRHFLH